MATRLPRAGGDTDLLAEHYKGAVGVTTNGSSEAVAEHQLALQRYIFEWTVRHEQLLLIVRSQNDGVDDVFSGETADSMARCEQRTLVNLTSVSAEADLRPPPSQSWEDGIAGPAPIERRSLDVALSAARAKPWRQSSEFACAKQSLGGISLRQESSGSLPSRLPDDQRGGEVPRVLSKRNLNSDLCTVQSLVDVYNLEPGPRSRYKMILMCEFLDGSATFQRFCSLVILANAFCLFFTIEFAIRNPSDPSYDVFHNLELAFCAFYITELVVRIGAQRRQFIVGKEVGWNVFDSILAASAVQEQVISMLRDSGQGSSGQNLSYLRVLRLLKVIKLLRMIRLMRAFRELRLVLNSILGSVKALIWSFCLIAGICFMFGVCFVQGVTELVIAEGWPSCAQINEEGEGSDAQSACEHWGSIGASMLSLFQASTNGYDWEMLAKPLMRAGGLYYGIFCFYIGFFLFVVMNSLTSLFIDSVISNAACDDDQIMQDQLHRKKEYMAKIVHIFSSIDDDGSGLITYEEFRSHKKDPMLVGFAQSLDIEPDSLEQFFGLLSSDGKRAVDLETFVVGCIRVRGPAKSMDLMDVLITQQRVAEDHARFMDYCGEQFCVIQRALQGVAVPFNRPRFSQNPSRNSLPLWQSLRDSVGYPVGSLQ